MAFITVNRSNLYKSVAFVSALAAFLFLTNILRLNPHIDSQAPPPISEPTFQVKIRSGFVVLQNYIKAEKWYKVHVTFLKADYIAAHFRYYGNESITYTSHSDATFLHNLIPMLKRWRGPLSIAIYAPGSDYDKVLRAIAYFRECPEGAHLVRKFTTFHIFYETRYAPSRIVDFGSEIVANCSEIPGDEGSDTFKKANNLLYPINVGRNVAREMATTHFVLPSDIELYPNPGMIQGFLHMMAHPEPMIRSSPRPKVYVVSIFEIEKDHEQPTTKADLLAAMKSGIVIPFHKRYCPLCHEIPGAEKWVRDDGTGRKKCVLLKAASNTFISRRENSCHRSRQKSW